MANPMGTLPQEVINILLDRGVIAAVRSLREIEGIGLKDAKQRVDAYIALDPALKRVLQPTFKEAIGDYLAVGWKAPLALGLGLGAFTLWIVGELIPDLSKKIDVGILLTVGLAAPMIGAALVWWFWARDWRRKREAAIALAPAAPVRPRFGGLPDPGARAVNSSEPKPGAASATLPPSARAAIDRDDPIEAIKILRAERGLGLAEAKALVDAARARRGA